MALAKRAHVLGWLAAALIAFCQPFGRIAADTKLDLTANPSGFLAAATSAWTDAFPMGQLQNQAYGYLFPQGAFFLLTESLPDWIAQRLWWTIVLCVGYSGMLLLLQRLRIGALPLQVIAAALFALSPRTLTTLTAISSETWPVMLVPWTLLPLLHRKPNVGASLLAVAMMGAVNATATLAALVPAAILLAWRRAPGALLRWGVGVVLVSAWWVVPLLVLGRYAPPFTDYIESAYVTTRWLNLPEVLRGTTSWTPFVDTERQAGYLLVSEPVFMVLTLAVAALGLIGLVRVRYRGLWLSMLCAGLLILLSAPLLTGFYDGPGAALRNLHKFDPLVRLPLMVGVAALPIRRPNRASGRAAAQLTLCALLAVGATAPAWSLRLLPEGTYTSISQDWIDAAEYVNTHAAGTRTLIWPGRSFAREDWGWTRDEPAQVLLDCPWLVRDAIPLVPPEAIRALDAVDASPTPAALARLGVGAVIVRTDATEQRNSPREQVSLPFGEAIATFGSLQVILLNPNAGMQLAPYPLPMVAGGGEIMADLPDGMFALAGASSADAEIFSDTPLLVARNYGRVDHATSAPLANLDEAEDVHNAVKDYASAAPSIAVTEVGGSVRASSSGADATSFGGADVSQGVGAAVDDVRRTAWYPTPGTGAGQWLELRPDQPVEDPVLEIEATGNPVEVTIYNGDPAEESTPSVTRTLQPKKPVSIPLPGGAATQVRIVLHGRAGIASAQLEGVPIRRVIDLGEVPDSARMLVLQGTRQLSLPRELHLTTGETLPAGPQVLEAGTYVEEGFEVIAAEPTGSTIEASPTTRVLNTTRAFNDGLRGWLGDIELEPIEVNAAQQGFIIPAGAEGEFRMEFRADGVYRLGLFSGGALAITLVLGLAVAQWLGRERRFEPLPDERTGWIPRWVLAGTWFSPARCIAITMSIAAMWCARGPWPDAAYIPGQLLPQVMCALAVLACLFAGKPHTEPSAEPAR